MRVFPTTTCATCAEGMTDFSLSCLSQDATKNVGGRGGEYIGGADVLCLQEVQADHFERWWRPEMVTGSTISLIIDRYH